MHQTLVAENVNIEEYPVGFNDFPSIKNSELTIGDIHGNALKLLYFLTRHQLITISELNYKLFVELYKKPAHLIVETDLESFNSILKEIKVVKNSLIRLLGDDLADWGSNDYFVLKILEKLINNEANIQILLSNHSIEFLTACEKNLLLAPDYPHLRTRLSFPLGQDASLQSLGVLLKRNLITREEIFHLLKECYLPSLHVFSYSVDKQEPSITLYSHAHAGIETIKAFEKKLAIIIDEYKPEQHLLKTIDAINIQLREIITNKQLQDFSELDKVDGKIRLEHAGLEYPLIRSIWHQGYEEAEFPKSLNGYKLYFVNGHSGNGEVEAKFKDYIFNLDNRLGKGSDWHNKGKYSVAFFSNVIKSPVPLDQAIQTGTNLQPHL